MSGGINTFYLQGYASSIIGIINTILVPVLLTVAFLVFVYGVFNYFILGAANESKRTEGAQFVLWAVVGFVVILSVWGLVSLLGSTLGLTVGAAPPPYPRL